VTVAVFWAYDFSCDDVTTMKFYARSVFKVDNW